MADNCWLCEEKDKDIERLRDEIRRLNRCIDIQQELLSELSLKKSNSVEQNFTITVCEGKITIEPLIEKED